MRDYARELLEVWTKGDDQSAFDQATELLKQIKDDIANAQREYSAIEAFIVVLRNRPGVSVAEEPDNGLDPIPSALRSRRIIETAKALFAEGLENRRWDSTDDSLPRVTTLEVLERIQLEGLTLGVQQPHAVIGTVLASAEGFERIARNTFEKRLDVPTSPQGLAEPDDLPF